MNDKQEIAVLGGRGMLGSDLCQMLPAAGFEPTVFDMPEFNILDETALKEVAGKYPVIVNCAAYTNVEKAETDRAPAFAVNGEAVGKLGGFAAETGAYVLHVSTDFVFDGTKPGAYSEEDEPNPLSAYGASKLEGELRLRESSCEHCIVRVQWTYGAGGLNFVEKIRDRAATGQPLKVVDDQVGTPTWTGNAADAMVRLLQKQCTGLFHFAERGAASRFEVAGKIVELAELKTTVEPCSTSDFPSAAKRPANSVFKCDKIDRTLKIKRPEWTESLANYLRENPIK